MSPKLHNDLRFYTLRITESSEMAEKMALDFQQKFAKLGKYDQMEMALCIQMDGWESAFQKMNNF